MSSLFWIQILITCSIVFQEATSKSLQSESLEFNDESLDTTTLLSTVYNKNLFKFKTTTFPQNSNAKNINSESIYFPSFKLSSPIQNFKSSSHSNFHRGTSLDPSQINDHINTIDPDIEKIFNLSKSHFSSQDNWLKSYHRFPISLSTNLQITDISVNCIPNKMIISITFSNYFNGIIYSKGFYNSTSCLHLPPDSNSKKFTFQISVNDCGMFSSIILGSLEKYFENSLVIQKDPLILTETDVLRKIRCKLGQVQEDIVINRYITTDDLEEQTLLYSANEFTVDLDLKYGLSPLGTSVGNAIVKLGDILTIVISLHSHKSNMDILARHCVLYPDDLNYSDDRSVDLTDSEGCALPNKILFPFEKQFSFTSSGTNAKTFASFKAIKFPGNNGILVECNVSVCINSCNQCREYVN